MSILLPVYGLASPAIAGAKAVARYKTEVEGQAFKIIRYDNDSVKVVGTGLIVPGYSYKLRNRMRQAAKQVTGCEIADDFDQDGKLIGTLVCAAVPAA
ncbi:hypothetical protein [Novosphingobium sp. PhB57]|uniref:hypothetical protein n=1 Tax=Novosphingobium sp. PhB57 TaxID=2485107 RepID=UPI001051C9D7|nr:hypothetical protein [Novosphingobium sp. PhB57]